MTEQYIQGTVVRFFTDDPFTSAGGAPVDPDVVVFSFAVQDAETIESTYGDMSSPITIVRDGVGLYHADVDTTSYGPGVWVYSFACRPSDPPGADSTHTQTLAEGEVIINVPSVVTT